MNLDELLKEIARSLADLGYADTVSIGARTGTTERIALELERLNTTMESIDQSREMIANHFGGPAVINLNLEDE